MVGGMKTKQQILDYLNDQEWFNDLDFDLDTDDIALLFPRFVMAFVKHPDYDWMKIYNDFDEWLNSEENESR